MEPVRNHRNPRVVEAARLHRARARRERRATLIEGPNLLGEALATGVRPLQLFALGDDRDTAQLASTHELELVLVDQRALERLAGTESPRGPVAEISIPDDRVPTADSVLVSWGVSDPGNVGTMIRTAAAFGWGFAFTPGSADPWAPKVLRAGAGGHFRTGVWSIDGLEELRDTGFAPVATVARGGLPPWEVEPARHAVLIGEEASGLDDETAAACEVLLTIPMPGGTESLNAAAAAAIVLYALTNDRGRPGPGSNLPRT